jgi:hypothetical protein
MSSKRDDYEHKMIDVNLDCMYISNTHLVNTSIRCPTISNVDFPFNDLALIGNEINTIEK